MSVLGIDVGNASSVVALARRNGIDVVLNSESKRETPSLINFSSKQARLHAAARRARGCRGR
jgi:heat shock protein 4